MDTTKDSIFSVFTILVMLNFPRDPVRKPDFEAE